MEEKRRLPLRSRGGRCGRRGTSTSRICVCPFVFESQGSVYQPASRPVRVHPALGRIRTDLDQFSPIEREVLMYHGYTLIDAQITKHCKKLKSFIRVKRAVTFQNYETASLSRPNRSGPIPESCAGETRLRKRVKDVLKAGSSRLFLFRSWQKYPKKSWVIFGPSSLSLLAGWASVIRYYCSVSPQYTQVLMAVVWIALWSYFVLFLTYVAMRWMVKRWDIKDYRSLTGHKPAIPGPKLPDRSRMENRGREKTGDVVE